MLFVLWCAKSLTFLAAMSTFAAISRVRMSRWAVRLRWFTPAKIRRNIREGPPSIS